MSRSKDAKCSCYLCKPWKHGKPADRLKPSERRKTEKKNDH